MLQSASLSADIPCVPLETSEILEEKVFGVLGRDPRLARREVYCHTEEGRVILRGWVRSFFEKQLAQEVLRRIEGVREICNELEVRSAWEEPMPSGVWSDPWDIDSEISTP